MSDVTADGKVHIELGLGDVKSPTSFARCVYTGRNLLYYLRRIRSILGSEADLFVNDLRGESVDRREELATAKSHVPFPALIVNGAFLIDCT